MFRDASVGQNEQGSRQGKLLAVLIEEVREPLTLLGAGQKVLIDGVNDDENLDWRISIGVHAAGRGERIEVQFMIVVEELELRRLQAGDRLSRFVRDHDIQRHSSGSVSGGWMK